MVNLIGLGIMAAFAVFLFVRLEQSHAARARDQQAEIEWLRKMLSGEDMDDEEWDGEIPEHCRWRSPEQE